MINSQQKLLLKRKTDPKPSLISSLKLNVFLLLEGMGRLFDIADLTAAFLFFYQ